MTFFKNPLYLRQYIYIFILTAVCIFITSGVYIYLNINKIKNDFILKTENESTAEIQHTILGIIDQVYLSAENLSYWDEIYQQIANPYYYQYWKQQRASIKDFPPYITDFDIYSSNMKILGDNNDEKNNLKSLNNYLYRQDNTIYFIHVSPVISRNDNVSIIGYIAIKADIIDALKNHGHLSTTDINSIQIRENQNKDISIINIKDHIIFKPLNNHLFDELINTTHTILIYGLIIVTLFTFFIYYITHYLVNKPLNSLTSYLELLKSGNLQNNNNFRFKIHELNDLKEAIDNYQSELTRVHTNLDEKNEELWKLAHHDPLTNTANRRAYEEDWKSYISIANNKRLDFSYMLIDCDHFKAINDTYGHDAGDRVIINLAKILQNNLRDGDKLYRIGGDEFVTILWDTNSTTADKVAQRCVDATRNHSFKNIGINEPVTISIGIATHFKDSTRNLELLPRQADIAMYNAKKTGSRSIIHYDTSLEMGTAPLMSNRIIDTVIKSAQTSEGICIHYQPVVNIKTGKIDYYEALIRLNDIQGIIGPGDIFPVAEKLSLEAELDLAIIEAIKNDLSSGLIPESTGVSINFSAALFSLPNLIEILTSLICYQSRYSIIFEVTEKTLITDIHTVSRKLEQLRQHGFQIALDDFGSGYSSIRYLANMPIDIVKFDISMTQQLLTEHKSRSIISGTAAVILGSGFKLVAEGIENTELQDLVINMGATHMQGYAIGKPMPLTDIKRDN